MLRRPPITYSPVELAEAEAAVSDERAHAKLQGQSRRGGVVRFGRKYAMFNSLERVTACSSGMIARVNSPRRPSRRPKFKQAQMRLKG
jgi:hypothetical protein